MIEQIYDLKADAEWPGVNSGEWRELPEPDSELDNDEDEKASQYVIDVLGVDPDELFGDQDWDDWDDDDDDDGGWDDDEEAKPEPKKNNKSATALFDRAASFFQREYDETKHERHPAGDEHGGEFASKDEGGSDSGSTSKTDSVKAAPEKQTHDGSWVKDVSAPEKKAIQGFTLRDYEWMRKRQKGETEPLKVGGGARLRLNTIGIEEVPGFAEMKDGDVWQGEDVYATYEFDGEKVQTERLVLEKGQKIVAIAHDSLYIKMTERQVKSEEAYADKVIQDLGNGLDKAPKYQGTLYRAMYHREMEHLKFRRQFKEGATIEFKADSSSTTDFWMAKKLLGEDRLGTESEDYGLDAQPGYMLVIQAKNAADIRAVNPSESEVVLRRNSKYRVTKVHGDTYHLEQL